MSRQQAWWAAVVIVGACMLSIGLGSAWAQIAVTDPATTTRSAVLAVLKERIVEMVQTQHVRLGNMARRLSGHTNLDKYKAPGPPNWQIHEGAMDLPYGDAYRAALNSGDPTGMAYEEITRKRQNPREALLRLGPDARAVVEQALATLDAADSSLITSTHYAGVLRSNGWHELSAIDALEVDTTDPDEGQSATAVLDKISGAALIEVRQKQARLQLMTSIVEQLLVDNKRTRDTEASALNMRLRQLHRTAGEEGSFITGASNDLRTWRQP